MITLIPDLSKGPAQEGTAAGDNVTVANPIGGSAGMHFTLLLIQDGTGGWTFSFGSSYYGVSPADFITTANTETRLRCIIKQGGSVSMSTDYTGVSLP